MKNIKINHVLAPRDIESCVVGIKCFKYREKYISFHELESVKREFNESNCFGVWKVKPKNLQPTTQQLNNYINSI